MQICVFSSSSRALGAPYPQLARQFGAALAERGHGLVYGGANIGLMGEVARAVHARGGSIVGVIPHALRDLELAYTGCTELILTETLRERKDVMDRRADAFVALPGGIGTFEELFEILTLKQLRHHDRAIVLLNANGYFDHLLAQLDRAIDEGFARPALRTLYHVATDPDGALDYLEAYRPSGIALADVVPGLAEAAVEAAPDTANPA